MGVQLFFIMETGESDVTRDILREISIQQSAIMYNFADGYVKEIIHSL